MRQRFFLYIIAALIINTSCLDQSTLYVRDVSQPVINLDGAWEVILKSYEDLKVTNADTIWNRIAVPGECMMQGIPIRHDQPFTYRKKISIPSDFKDKLVKIRFEGVYSYAKIWINGNFVGDHNGGFTVWEYDITSFVESGKDAVIHVEVTDRADEISYASGYAKHQIGGILRSVSLLALPENYPELLNVITDFDQTYENADLIIEGEIRKPGENCSIELRLFDGDNREVRLMSPSAEIKGKEFKISNQVKNPLKWDAEHPNLYELKVTFRDKDQPVWQKNYEIGFREIEVQKNKFYINGTQVKLRGACRHDVHPLLGRVSTPEYDLMDVRLAKEANINFIRTSHYPPTEKFLEYCDQYGIYVEDETAVCFVGSYRTSVYKPGASENSPGFTERYLSQLKEMINNHRNHPSVIIWSIGNENTFGSNFEKSYNLVKSSDTTRPVIFSYPGYVPDSIKAYDLLSMHYPGTKGNMNQIGIKTVSFGHEKMPVLFDEWAHVPCYNNQTLSEDQNIRDFWGISLDSMWQRTYEAEGGLGGAIWGMIDESFMLPAELPGFNDWWGKLDQKNALPDKFTGPDVGYGEWGIIDIWRRKKPEFWSVTKAYSPVRVLKTDNYKYVPGEKVEIPVYNRFDFTNLNEIIIKASLNNRDIPIEGVDVPPHSKGHFTASPDEWPAGKKMLIEFYDKDGTLIDSYRLSGFYEDRNDLREEGRIELTANDREHIITCNNGLIFIIDKETGLFTSYEKYGERKFISGPLINLRIVEKGGSDPEVIDLCRNWKLESVSLIQKKNTVEISLTGTGDKNLKTRFITLVYPDGTISSSYSIMNLPKGKLKEAGLKYILSNDFDTLKWHRKSYWSSYPVGHLSEPEGQASLYSDDNKTYRTKPEKQWQYDKKSFYYDGIENEANDALLYVTGATKENIFTYNLCSKGKGDIIVSGNGESDCRTEKSGDKIILLISNEIDYPDISWGNYSRNIEIKDNYSGKADMTIR